MAKNVFRQGKWLGNPSSKTIYLTFDDGPIPEITPWVLNLLEAFDLKATFFCVGDNVQKYPVQFKALVDGGHRIGNHTYHHLNGWKTPAQEYYDDIEHCRKVVDSDLFRPPYGKLSLAQYHYLKTRYSLIFWSQLSYDFDPRLPPQDCLRQLLRNTQNGSIVVFHDSLKAMGTLKKVLPVYLEACIKNGFQFDLI